MQGPDKAIGQNVAATSPRKPHETLLNIGLFQFIKLTACRDVTEFKSMNFIRFEGRGAFCCLEH